LDFCNQLFALEKKFENLKPDERQKEREKQSKPIAEAFFVWARLTVGNPVKSLQAFDGKGGVAKQTNIRGVFCPEWSLVEQTTPRAARTGFFAIPKRARAPAPSFIPSSKPPKKTV
jgi:hypothetical protein